MWRCGQKTPGFIVMNDFPATNRKMITYTKDGYRLNGENKILFSGEFPYFRVPKQDWRTRLRLWREAGGNTLATYLPRTGRGKVPAGPDPPFSRHGGGKKLFLIARPGTGPHLAGAGGDELPGGEPIVEGDVFDLPRREEPPVRAAGGAVEHSARCASRISNPICSTTR